MWHVLAWVGRDRASGVVACLGPPEGPVFQAWASQGEDEGVWGFMSYMWVAGLVGCGREAPCLMWCCEYTYGEVRGKKWCVWCCPEVEGQGERNMLLKSVWCN